MSDSSFQYSASLSRSGSVGPRWTAGAAGVGVVTAVAVVVAGGPGTGFTVVVAAPVQAAYVNRDAAKASAPSARTRGSEDRVVTM